MQRSNKPIYVLVLALALAVGLWLWLRPDNDPTDTPDSKTKAATTTNPKAAPTAVPLLGTELDPLTAPKATATGTVRDESGEPIAGAQVCATVEDSDVAGTERMPPTCATTREDGTYRLPGLLGLGHNFDASARGYLPERFEFETGIQRSKHERVVLVSGQTREGVDFVLERGGVELLGVVKDIAGGEVEGAWVSSGGGWWRDGAGRTFTRSGEDGGFSMWVGGPETRVSAHAEGYGRSSRRAVVPGTFVELFLTPESVVVGTVVWAESEEPVADARVSTRGGVSAYSEADGSFRLEGLEPGSYKIRAADDELVGSADEKVHVGLGETSEAVVVRAHHSFVVRGTVVLEGEQGCSFATVRLQDKARKSGRGHGSEGQEDGSVSIAGLLPGTYEVTVNCPGFLPEEDYEDIVIADDSVEGLSWSVHHGQAIRGVVVDADGAPLTGVSVSARMKAGSDPRGRRSSSWGEQTDAKGQFEVAGLLPGSYELYASHEDRPRNDDPEQAELVEGADTEGIVITLPEGGAVEGSVVDEKGEPVGGVSVRLKGPRWGGRADTNDAGRFMLESVSVGDYRISASRGWSGTMRAPGASDDDAAGERISVVANETTTVELVVESQKGRITGRVVDEDGGPVADAFVEAVRESDSAAKSEGRTRSRVRWGSWSSKPILTDEDGRFELTNLAESGVFSIYANRKGGGEAIAEHVPAGTDVELSVAETGVLAGAVTLAGGGVPERFSVSVRDRQQGINSSDRFLRTGGKWTISNLPAGSFEVVVTSSEGTAKVEVELTEGAAKTDIALELTPRVKIKGQLVDAETGEPIAALKVAVSGQGGGISWRRANKPGQEDISDAQGNFVVEDAPAGKVRLLIMAQSRGNDDYAWQWIPKRIVPEPAVQDLGAIALIKKRIDRGEESGDVGFKLKEQDPGTEPEDVRNVVAFVRPGGAGAKAGLSVGDEIVTIDNHDVKGANSHRYRQLARVRPGRTLSLGLADGRSIKVVVGSPL